jgi:NTP pyrophosphatase (non-canonical NTP hydrolase)
MSDSDTNVIIPDDLRPLNQTRCDRWHPPTGDDWTLGDWGNALAGEVGELANVVKKIRRHQSGHATGYNTPELDELRSRFVEEVADVLLYLDLLVWKAGVEPEQVRDGLCDKFNLVSLAQGWSDLQWDGGVS